MNLLLVHVSISDSVLKSFVSSYLAFRGQTSFVVVLACDCCCDPVIFFFVMHASSRCFFVLFVYVCICCSYMFFKSGFRRCFQIGPRPCPRSTFLSTTISLTTEVVAWYYRTWPLLHMSQELRKIAQGE